jgi:hypothetical protein
MRRAALAALAGLVLVAAGCGGERLTQAQFEAKTKAICAAYTKRAQKELAPFRVNPTSPNATPLDVARFGRLFEHVATLFGRQLDDLRRVRPPAESTAQYAKVLRLLGQTESALTRVARAARRGDRLAIARVELELGATAAQIDALGFKCE